MNLTWLGFCNLLHNPLNLTWLCTKASWNLFRNLLRNPVEPEPCWTWPGSAPKPHRPSPEPSPEPCWTWPGSAPKPPRPPPEPSPEPSPEPCWTWLGFRNPVEPDLAGTFGTFSGTSLNLTRRLHQCTPELFWAEDPISLRCLGTTCSVRTVPSRVCIEQKNGLEWRSRALLASLRWRFSPFEIMLLR